jgi:hypothetical protein
MEQDMTARRRVVLALATAVATATAVTPARAQDLLSKIEVHGYGGWSFGRTMDNVSSNFFLFAHARGDYFHNEFALNLAAPLTDRVTIIAQPFWHSGHHANQTSSGMDYVFGEYKWSDAVRLRVGNVKQPFGIYTEVFDVGTLRPFAALSQAVYGPSGMIGKSYSGIGLTGTMFTQHALSVDYDLYGGGLETLEDDTPLQVLAAGTASNVLPTRTFRDVIGGRVILRTPIDGLSFGTSAFTGTRPLTKAGVLGEWRRSVIGAHAELVNDAWWLRAEYANEAEQGAYRSQGGYGEAAYFLTDRWQLAGTYGRHYVDPTVTYISAANQALGASLLNHTETGGGLNYWLTRNFVVKTSYHHVTGNRFSHPDANPVSATVPSKLQTITLGNLLMKTTDAVMVSGHVSF